MHHNAFNVCKQEKPATYLQHSLPSLVVKQLVMNVSTQHIYLHLNKDSLAVNWNDSSLYHRCYKRTNNHKKTEARPTSGLLSHSTFAAISH